jgi:NADH-quinone oxidoreductase subunit N
MANDGTRPVIAFETQLEAFAPLCIVALSALLLVMSDAVLMKTGSEATEREIGTAKGAYLATLAGFFLFLALVSAGFNFQFAQGTSTTLHSMLVVDPMAAFAMILLCAGGLLTLGLSLAQLPAMKIHHGEFYPLLLLSIVGALAVVCAENLISLFVAFELMSLPLYVLVGFDRDRARSNEAGMRALLMGVFASALSLYGVALIYGATGHFDYPGIRDALNRNLPLALGGVALLLVAIVTRLSAAPFHQWWPDLTRGAPAVVAAYVPTTVVTASGFALIRILDSIVPVALPGFTTIVALLSGISMIVGALMALLQSNVKRLLAYGGIAHTGFFLAALVVPTTEGRGAALLHITVFFFMQLGAFGVISAMARKGMEWEDLSEYSGLAECRPILAAAFCLFLLALAGLPGTSGFVSRFVVMSVAIGAGQVFLTILMGITSVVLFAAYLRVPAAMYMRHATEREGGTPALPAVIALAICAFATLYLGFFPGQGPLPIELLEMVGRAAGSR